MKRIASLDSLRGIAAMVVVLGHCAAVYPGFLEAMHDAPVLPLPLPLAASAAVSVFFVLSGLVLYLTFTGVDRFAWQPYLVKRVLRIYPPLAVAVVGSALLAVLLGPPAASGHSVWFATSTWSVPPSPGLVLRHLLLLDTPRDQTLDPVIWSLVHEMRMSLVFPLIAFAVARRPAAALAGALVLSLVARKLSFLHPEAGWPIDPFATLQYTWLFAAGAVLAARTDMVGRFVTGRRGIVVLVASMLLASVQPRWAAGLATGLGAIGLVALCAAGIAVRRAIERPALEWLGRVSYALYLVHLPVLHAVVRSGTGALPLPLLLALAVAASLAAAELLHRAVERPAIALGRRLARPGVRPSGAQFA